MNEQYNSIILKALYDLTLERALRFTDNYETFRNKSYVSKKLQKRDFIISYLDGTLSFLRDYKKITSTFKHNVFSLLNDIRFNYSYRSKEEKCNINNKINQIIILVNKADVLDALEAVFLRDVEMMITNTFYIVHHYLTDDDTFKKEGIPFLQKNEYYIDSLYFLLEVNPNLLQDKLFLQRTYMLLNPDIEKVDEKEEKYIKKLKKNLTKELRRR